MNTLLITFFYLCSFIFSQNLFVDGVAAVVEGRIILKSDLNQMVNMVAIQQKIDPLNFLITKVAKIL